MASNSNSSNRISLCSKRHRFHIVGLGCHSYSHRFHMVCWGCHRHRFCPVGYSHSLHRCRWCGIVAVGYNRCRG